jgi:hypothetical protein
MDLQALNEFALQGFSGQFGEFSLPLFHELDVSEANTICRGEICGLGTF